MGVNDFVTDLATWCVVIVETIGIAIITLFALYGLLNAGVELLRKAEKESVFQELRQSLGRGILLGLEFLIASDIIYTVAIELSFRTVGALAIVVFIRTFLSVAIEVEISGRWPWQNKQQQPE